MPLSTQKESVLNQPAKDRNWIATCPKGLELLLAEELTSLGALDVKETIAAVYFNGSMEIAYRCCLWSRLANRILKLLHHFVLNNTEDLYEQASEINWELD